MADNQVTPTDETQQSPLQAMLAQSDNPLLKAAATNNTEDDFQLLVDVITLVTLGAKYTADDGTVVQADADTADNNISLNSILGKARSDQQTKTVNVVNGKIAGWVNSLISGGKISIPNQAPKITDATKRQKLLDMKKRGNS